MHVEYASCNVFGWNESPKPINATSERMSFLSDVMLITIRQTPTPKITTKANTALSAHHSNLVRNSAGAVQCPRMSKPLLLGITSETDESLRITVPKLTTHQHPKATKEDRDVETVSQRVGQGK